MSLLAPAAAALGLTLPVIVALYFLKIRRPTRVVPALHLWPNQIRDRQANVPWQRLRPSWLLLLQLLAAALLVGAALQPVLPVGAALARHTIVLVDSSASMQATDVKPTRLAEAKRQAGALIDQQMKMMIPLGGTLGEPARDVGPMLVFLAGRGSGFITGQLLAVDGGLMMVGG